jgi:hypothetical protein
MYAIYVNLINDQSIYFHHVWLFHRMIKRQIDRGAMEEKFYGNAISDILLLTCFTTLDDAECDERYPSRFRSLLTLT